MVPRVMSDAGPARSADPAETDERDAPVIEPPAASARAPGLPTVVSLPIFLTERLDALADDRPAPGTHVAFIDPSWRTGLV
jgi:hypothetical protein